MPLKAKFRRLPSTPAPLKILIASTMERPVVSIPSPTLVHSKRTRALSTYLVSHPNPSLSFRRAAAAAVAFSTHTVEPHRGKPPRISRPFQDSNNSSRAAAAAGAGLLAAACLAAASSAWNSRQPSCERAAPPSAETREGYPIISKAEVAKHKSAEAGGAWVTYAGGVYDITEFIANHPGGAARISMAAGGALEPFWKLYAIHKKDEVK